MSHHDRRKAERQDNLVPEPENQAAGGSGPPAGTPNVDVTGGTSESAAGADRDTGAGTGGATQSDARPGLHEGAHRGNQPNS
jgi:hypothetical protein